MGFFSSMKGVSFPLIRNDFNASFTNMGLLTALISYSMVSFCIVSGNFLHRFGLKKNILTGFLITSLGVGSFYFAKSFWMVACFFIILQAGFGFLEVGTNGLGARIFTVKSGLMMNLLHFCYGLGAITGPRFMGYMVNRGTSWQRIYPLSLILVGIMLVFSLIVRFPGRPEARAEQGPSFWSVLKDPLVWHLGCILGLSGVVEGSSVNWSGLYFQDVFGLDPSVTTAALISTFYLLFTVSRFISGFVIEKIGYLRSLIASCFAIIVIFTAAFSLGLRGIYLFPVIGFFVALMWPTTLAISVVLYKERAQTVSSAIICIASVLGGIIHYGIGLSNRFLGAAWGFRSVLLYSAILALLLFLLKKQMRLRKSTTPPHE
ncbi:MAG: MFS transporter [Treponema sp.]|nr:MFS transporter [Treponema sp.]